MAVIISGSSSPSGYEPYNPQVTITQWQLSPGASIAVLVCLPITAFLFFMIGLLVGMEREKRRARAAAEKKRKNDGVNQNGGGDQGGPGGPVVPPALPANADGNLPGHTGHVGNQGQVGNPGQAGNPNHGAIHGQATQAA